MKRNQPATDGVDNMEVKNLSEATVEAGLAAHAKGGDRLEQKKKLYIIINIFIY